MCFKNIYYVDRLQSPSAGSTFAPTAAPAASARTASAIAHSTVRISTASGAGGRPALLQRAAAGPRVGSADGGGEGGRWWLGGRGRAVGWGEAPPLAAVSTPIPLPGTARVQRPGRRGELYRRSPPSSPRLCATAAALPGKQPPPGPGCLARMLRPGRHGELCCPVPFASAPPPRSRVATAAAAAAATADGPGCRARAALGSSAVGRSLHTYQTSRPSWAAALQRPGASPGPARRAAPPPPSPQRAPLRHCRSAPGDAAGARAGLPRPGSRRAPPRPAATAQLLGAPPARPPSATCPPLSAHHDAAPRSTTSCSATALYRFRQRNQRCPQPRAPRHHCRRQRPR